MGFGTVNTHIILFITITGAASLFVGDMVTTTYEAQTATGSETRQSTETLSLDYEIISANIQQTSVNATNTTKCSNNPCNNLKGSIYLQNTGRNLRIEQQTEVILENKPVQNKTYVRAQDLEYTYENAITKDEIIEIQFEDIRETNEKPERVTIRIGPVTKTKSIS